MLVNLIVNAIQAMPKGGALRISAQDAEKTLQLVVEDTGTGMPPEVLSRIFDPFYTTKRAEGTGLGLSISRQITEALHGQISAENRRDAGGTVIGARFIVRLPRV